MKHNFGDSGTVTSDIYITYQMGNTMNNNVILDVTDLHIEFHDHDKPETVVEDFDLMLEAGEIVGIVGESGSGKSMSALAIAGLLKRHALTKKGKIMFDGTDLLTCDRKTLRSYQGDEISMIFQEPMTSLNPVKKIGWQVEESLRIHHKEMDKAERKRRALKMLEAVGLNDLERPYDKYPHQLSGGQRQRVMIAAAMIAEPRILIADEPTTALDVTIQAQIVELLRKMNREKGTAIIFISHDLSLIRQICSRVIVMQNGNIVETGNVEEIFKRPSMNYTRKLIAAIPQIDLD
ncbi:ABC transporter ATP-binding protein [Butyrivibrio sp. WCE2006]|uniref:ABC transporter ATP-binding protein n=2 Tax=unclassified Butyrivibrio TaxID=2639466 RepID=UPI0006787939|nr:ABC transporter ATP-binding protein [Butyrivibrio sp. WCE2006]